VSLLKGILSLVSITIQFESIDKVVDLKFHDLVFRIQMTQQLDFC